MPYVNIRNTLIKYAPVTGMRGVLSAHGVNDGGSSTSEFKFNSQQVVAKTRQESIGNLAWMMAKSAWRDGSLEHIVEAQTQLIAEDSQIYEGPHLNDIGNLGRTDNLHFNEQGQVMAAQKWADALVGSSFLSTTARIPSTPQTAGLPPVSAATGAWGTSSSWQNSSAPAPAVAVFIKQPHTITLDGPKTVKSLHLAGTLQLSANGQLILTGN